MTSFRRNPSRIQNNANFGYCQEKRGRLSIDLPVLLYTGPSNTSKRPIHPATANRRDCEIFHRGFFAPKRGTPAVAI